MKSIHVTKDLENPIVVDEDLEKLEIKLDRGKRAEVVHYKKTPKQETKIILEPNSQLDYYAIQKQVQDNSSTGEAELKENAKLNLIQTDVGSGRTSNNFTIKLLGRKAEANVISLFHGREQDEAEVSIRVDHVAEETKSNLYSRGIITNKAKNTYKGLIKIHKTAKNAEGRQESQTLTLEEAEAYATPELEIDNNQVACSHASSVGQIDRGKIFYLMSRGLSEKEAEQLIVKGFYEPAFKKIWKEEMKEEIKKLIEERI